MKEFLLVTLCYLIGSIPISYIVSQPVGQGGYQEDGAVATWARPMSCAQPGLPLAVLAASQAIS
jgi:glycerol-3-phosphate acyltransferase PlsY